MEENANGYEYDNVREYRNHELDKCGNENEEPQLMSDDGGRHDGHRGGVHYDRQLDCASG